MSPVAVGAGVAFNVWVPHNAVVRNDVAPGNETGLFNYNCLVTVGFVFGKKCEEFTFNFRITQRKVIM